MMNAGSNEILLKSVSFVCVVIKAFEHASFLNADDFCALLYRSSDSVV